MTITTLTSRFPSVARVLFGGLLLASGAAGLLGLAPTPPMPEAAAAFMGALAATGYMLPLIKGTELVAGALIMSGRLTPLGLALLAPVTVNIALFHALLAPAVGPIVLVLGGHAYLAYHHRRAFSDLFDTAPPAATRHHHVDSPAARHIEAHA